jgi:hypothetical protein
MCVAALRGCAARCRASSSDELPPLPLPLPLSLLLLLSLLLAALPFLPPLPLPLPASAACLPPAAFLPFLAGLASCASGQRCVRAAAGRRLGAWAAPPAAARPCDQARRQARPLVPRRPRTSSSESLLLLLEPLPSSAGRLAEISLRPDSTLS